MLQGGMRMDTQMKRLVVLVLLACFTLVDAGPSMAQSTSDETMLLANVAVERVREARTKFPVLQDRRLR